MNSSNNSKSLVSIVIANWNTVEITKKCLACVKKFTQQPYEIILIDNGSTDGSQQEFEKLSSPLFTLICLDENIGFAGANNIGIEHAAGEYIVLLNSDAFVTRNWLSKMLTCMNRNNADMIGPCSNNVKGKQYYGMRAKGLLPNPLRKTEQVNFLSFFCVLIKSSVFEKIGLIETKFGIGYFEDDDFCKRAIKNNLTLFIDGKTWVWHLGQSTIKKNNIDFNELYKKNQVILESIWNKKG